MSELMLPEGVRQIEHPHAESGKVSAVFELDPDIVYPAWQALLADQEYPAGPGGYLTQLDQYWLEVIYQCAKLDVQAALLNTDFDLRIVKKPYELKILNRPAWALRNFPVKRNPIYATKRKEARKHYTRIRGQMPLING